MNRIHLWFLLCFPILGHAQVTGINQSRITLGAEVRGAFYLVPLYNFDENVVPPYSFSVANTDLLYFFPRADLRVGLSTNKKRELNLYAGFAPGNLRYGEGDSIATFRTLSLGIGLKLFRTKKGAFAPFGFYQEPRVTFHQGTGSALGEGQSITAQLIEFRIDFGRQIPIGKLFLLDTSLGFGLNWFTNLESTGGITIPENNIRMHYRNTHLVAFRIGLLYTK